MCGIAGILKFNEAPVELAKLRAMTDAIAHRGPDGEGHWINDKGNIGFGHRRLSIIDLSDLGKQPMNYLDGRYTITYNGEIYNYIEIREKLRLKGYQFKSNTDTEVLLALYHEKRERCLDDLDGMFAFAIWDEKEQELFCARDRFGEKPFFYTIENDTFYFASEIKCFWQAGLNKTPDLETAFYYLHYGRVHHPFDNQKTYYQKIKKLKSAHYILLKTDKNLEIKQTKYWQLPPEQHTNTSSLSVPDIQDRFYDLFRTSILRRLRSDVPVGSSLSGGLDSSAIVCMINHINEKKEISQNTFSARFPGFSKDEGYYMQLVINATNAHPHYTYPDKDGFLKNFERLCYHQDEPFGSASIYAQYEVMRLANHNHVTVLLDGQGADEMLAGYAFYRETENLEHSKIVNNTLQAHYDLVATGIKPYLKRKIETIAPGFYQKISKVRLNKRLRKNFLLEGYTNDFTAFAMQLEYPNENHTSLYKHLRHDLTEGNLEDLLRYSDRNSMAFSREVRLPFLCHELVEFVMALSSTFKLKEEWSKWILRTSLEEIMPAKIVWRKDKIGYEPPQKDWMSDKLFAEKIINSREQLVKQGILNKDIMSKIPEPSAANQRGDKSWEHLMLSTVFN